MDAAEGKLDTDIQYLKKFTNVYHGKLLELLTDREPRTTVDRLKKRYGIPILTVYLQPSHVTLEQTAGGGD